MTSRSGSAVLRYLSLIGSYQNIILPLNCASFSVLTECFTGRRDLSRVLAYLTVCKPLMIKARSDSFQNKSDLFKSLCVWRSTVMLAESADQKQDDL